MGVLQTHLKTFIKLLIVSTALHCQTLAAATETEQSPWQFELGGRYWLSGKRNQLNLFGFDSNLASRLTYQGMTSNAGEVFGRLSYNSGLFVKGYLGGGSNNNGQLFDQDFPPGITYSRTRSEQSQGWFNYFSFDLGYPLFRSESFEIAPFVGFHHWFEVYNTFGCAQTSGGEVCAAPITLAVNGLNDHFTWNALRLGANGQWSLSSTFGISVDAAYTRSHLKQRDYHNIRPSIRGMPITGDGNGVQIDALLHKEIQPNLTVGLGGRWWFVSINGFANFNETPAGGQPQPIEVTQNIYGLLLQTNYKFDDGQKNHGKNSLSDFDFLWSGLYFGANVGYGQNQNSVDIDTLSQAAQANRSNIPSALQVSSGGFVTGGQLGYNWLTKNLLLGVEADFDYADIGGANAETYDATNFFTTSAAKHLGWYGTLRPRIGKLLSDHFMIYATGGLAWGNTELNFDTRDLASTCVNTVCASGSKKETKLGGTVGAGIEYAVSQHATFKVDYLYLDLGHVNFYPLQDLTGTMSFKTRTNFNYNLLRFGVNYKV